MIRSITDGPPELRAHLPVTATALNVLPDTTGAGEYWCARLADPVKYRLPEDFDRHRCQPEFLGADEHGDFLWVLVVVVHAQRVGQRLHSDMRALPVFLAYVVNLNLKDDAVLDPAKIDWVAVAEIDGLPQNTEIPPATTSANGGNIASTNAFRVQVREALQALAGLAGMHYGPDIPHPVEIPAGQPASQQRPEYSLDGRVCVYHTLHPTHGWTSTSTADHDELLYWICDDVARAIAWRWAQRAPAFADMTPAEAQHFLWTPYWQALMNGLNLAWADRTRRTIAALTAGDDDAEGPQR